MPLYGWENLKSEYDDPVFDYYIAAIQHQERKKMPDVSDAVDRRALTEAIASTQHVRALVCFVCAQVKVDTGKDHTHSEITLPSKNTQIICEARRRDYNSVKFNLSLPFFRETYMQGPNASPWRNATELDEDKWEWRRIFRFSEHARDTLEVLCCPEDVESCKGKHDEHTICSRCSLPLCSSCRAYFSIEAGGNEGSFVEGGVKTALPYCIPMALVNDNMWGYTTSLLVRYQR